MAKTKMVTTAKDGKGKKKGTKKNFAKQMTRKKHATHSGYGMKHIVAKQMTYKRKGRKR